MAGRHITNSAVKTATTQTSAVHTVQNQARQAAAAGQAASDAHVNSEVHMGGASVHTENNGQTGAPSQDGVILTGSEAPLTIPADPTPQGESTSVEAVPVDLIPPDGGVVITGGDTTVQASQTENTSLGGPEAATEVGGEQVHTERVQTSHTSVSSEKERISHFQSSGTRPTLGGMIFSRSLEAGGSFANDVIGTVARGEVAGSITGDMAAQSLQSYLGYTAQGSPPPIFTDAEIGGGRITGQVSTPDYPQPIAFGLYHTEQYMEPKGEFTKIRSADGTLWYSQLAQDTVERKPYQAPDGTVAYKERIVKKLPDPPKRKDRV